MDRSTPNFTVANLCAPARALSGSSLTRSRPPPTMVLVGSDLHHLCPEPQLGFERACLLPPQTLLRRAARLLALGHDRDGTVDARV